MRSKDIPNNNIYNGFEIDFVIKRIQEIKTMVYKNRDCEMIIRNAFENDIYMKILTKSFFIKQEKLYGNIFTMKDIPFYEIPDSSMQTLITQLVNKRLFASKIANRNILVPHIVWLIIKEMTLEKVVTIFSNNWKDVIANESHANYINLLRTYLKANPKLINNTLNNNMSFVYFLIKTKNMDFCEHNVKCIVQELNTEIKVLKREIQKELKAEIKRRNLERIQAIKTIREKINLRENEVNFLIHNFFKVENWNKRSLEELIQLDLIYKNNPDNYLDTNKELQEKIYKITKVIFFELDISNTEYEEIVDKEIWEKIKIEWLKYAYEHTDESIKNLFEQYDISDMENCITCFLENSLCTEDYLSKNIINPWEALLLFLLYKGGARI